MSNIIDILEQAQFKQDLPQFNPGDTLVVQVKVIEGSGLLGGRGVDMELLRPRLRHE